MQAKSHNLTPILTARPQTDELGLLVQGVDELEPKKPLTDP